MEVLDDKLPAGLEGEAPPSGEGVFIFPVSYAQKGLWLLSRFEPDSAAYNIAAAFRMEGALEVGPLERSLNEVVRRHEILRTTIEMVEEQLVQIVHPPDAGLRIAVVELGGLTKGEGALRVRRLAVEHAREPFDLSRRPLLRVELLRLSEAEHVLLLSMHHIVGDGWSTGVFIRELAALYKAFSAGRPSPLEELPLQYADFALWQEEWLRGEVLETQLSYWRKQLEGAPPVIELPADRPRPAVESFKGEHLSFHTSPRLLATLKELSRKEGVTLFMTLLAAFQTLLYRYTGQRDVVVGSPIANRNRAETEQLIGFFVNMLVLRTSLEGNPRFGELLGRVREMTLGAYAHQDVPFERLVEELQPRRDLSRAPVFQVMFILQNAPASAPELAGVELTALDVDNRTAKFDLTLSMREEAAGELSGTLEYNSDLFDNATARRMAAHLEVMLLGIAESPHLRVDELPLLTSGERSQLLVEWNDTESPYAEDRTLHELFEEQAGRTPGAVAVQFGDELLTYAELDARSNQLAHHLRDLGVKSETLVGISVDRSIEMVVGLLGILKSGGAYVPIDPEYPLSRRAYVLEDAGLSVLITQQHLVSQLPGHDLDLVRLDSDWPAISRRSERRLVPLSTSGNLAYTIYTSGSTGRPKGVQISHRAVVNFLTSMREEPGVDSSDILLSVTTLSFDIAALELYLPLLNGARLVIVSRETAVDGKRLAKAVVACGATIMQATPATWRLLLEAQWAGDARLKMLCGGEALSGELAARLLGCGDSLWNMYGPTETTIWSTLKRVESVETSVIEIGRPIANTLTYVLDEHLQIVPAGIPGELYIGGDGLARGYLHRADLSAEKFVPHPFGRKAGERLYRTGDQARFLADGRIEFLGRLDRQVKIRGHRIETGEVEAVLVEHPSVRDAAVVVAEDAARGDKRLVAYLIVDPAADGDDSEQLKGGADGDAHEEADDSLTRRLRDHVSERLPSYMMPSAFVTLNSLPLTPNGKVDRQALATLEITYAGAEESYVAPSNATETAVAVIWAEVLGLTRVGVHDDFFEVGGHSLSATQVISRLGKVFNVELALRTIFEAPTIAKLSEKIEAACREEQGLRVPPITPLARERNCFPLSFAQQRLWFVHQLELDNSAYNVSMAVRLTGHLDVPAFERTLAEIIRRHEVLRTTFAEVDGRPVQVINPPAGAAALPVVELNHLPPAEREAEAKRFIAAEARRPFDLAEGPLLRASLLHFGEYEHVAAMTMHHIVVDGWSMGVLIREVSILYAAYAEGRPSPLPELSIQYADFAHWQQHWLQGEVLSTQLDYWEKQLAGAPSMMDLPTDRPRPPVQTHHGAQESWWLSAELAQALRELSRREGVTLFMTLLAAWQVLLSRYTNHKDIVVGADVANRNLKETEDLIGFFVNMLVLRTDLSGNPGFSSLLKRVREVCLNAYAHQHAPFEKLVEKLQPETARNLSHTPLFQVLFVLQNAPTEDLRLASLTLNVLDIEVQDTQFDLLLDMQEHEEGLRATLRFNTDLFDATTIRRMAGHLRTLLEGIVADPRRSLSDLPLLTEAERRLTLRGWGEHPAPPPPDGCIHELFEEQARLRPQDVAVVSGRERVTYAELNASANRLAHHLRALGVRPEVGVGLCLERGVGMVVAMLGVLKAGGAYVPLDPRYPLERLAFMLADARVPVLVTREDLLDSLPSYHGQAVCLDSDAADVGAHGDANPVRLTTNDNLAYVMYTSGSTGQPKGVSVPHRGVVRLVRQSHYAEFGPAEVFLQLAPVSFDASTFEVWGSLLNGGRLVVMPPHAPSLRELGEAIKEHGVTTLWLTSGLFNLMVDERLEDLRPLRQLLAGGDVLSVAHVGRFLDEVSDCRLINGYGPTENTTFTCCHTMRVAGIQGSVPIGRPIAHTQVYILDGEREPVPVGVAGELYVGGEGLARGYAGGVALTAEKFVPHNHSEKPGERLYRTGDLARYLPDGVIEFLGRTDEQVKVRGFRIELGEIEMALSRHPAVREAVMAVKGEVSGEKQLVAYVVCEPGRVTTPGELRDDVKSRLPEYMVPQVFVLLDELPLNANGKVDRSALPTPARSRSDIESAYVMPRTPVEEVMAGIWGDVLGVEVVGAGDNFFDLGGHSLLATQVMSRIREAFGVEVALRELFERPTVRELGGRVEEARRVGEGVVRDEPRMERVERGAGVVLSFAQQRLWFLDQLEPGTPLYNCPGAAHIRGPLDVSALEESLNEIIARHESLRTSFTTVAGAPVQVIHGEWKLRLEVEDIGDRSEAERAAEVERRAQAEARHSFNLAEGPLLRVKLLCLSDDEYVVLFTMHHIISDAQSLGLFLNELATCYEARRRGEEAGLAALPIQYADYAVWQRGYLTGEVLERQLAYWRGQLGGAPAVLELPSDRPRPAEQTYRGAQQAVAVGAGVAEQLRALSRREGATLYMTLLAAFGVLLHYYTRGEDIVVGTNVSNRGRRETDQMIGFFVNQLPMRTNLSGDPTFRGLLRQVRDVTLDAYAHQDIPFDRLVEALKIERNLSRTPLFQVKIDLLGTPLPDMSGTELSFTPLPSDTGGSHLDLIFSLADTGGELTGLLFYNTDLFDQTTVVRMFDQFKLLLTQVIAEPDARLSALVAPLAEDDGRRAKSKEEEFRSSKSRKLKNLRRGGVAARK